MEPDGRARLGADRQERHVQQLGHAVDADDRLVLLGPRRAGEHLEDALAEHDPSIDVDDALRRIDPHRLLRVHPPGALGGGNGAV